MGVPVLTAGRHWRTGLVVTPFLLSCAVFWAVYSAHRDCLPDRLATHFSGSGHADGFSSAGSLPVVALTLLLVAGLLFGVWAYAIEVTPKGWRGQLVFAYVLAAFLGYVHISVVLVNSGHENSADQVSLSLWELPKALGAAALAAALGLLLATLVAPAQRKAAAPAAPGPRLDLGRDESAVWTRTVGSPVLRLTGFAETVAGLALCAAGLPFAGVSLVLVGALSAVGGSGARITVDRHGLTAVPAWLPFPRLHIPLERITSAASRRVRLLKDIGGWGYRVRPGQSALAMRSGDALVATLSTGSEFLITVDDAATAARLLNALIVRDGRPADQGG
ncbi:DUF1648 domain-containing protein [Streptomyces orinoci]|uniref:DUF1648 domain-containing protein n=1 Tax=Streptomyces orinoci TaxID=67339 RepID=A0ABV3K4V3_STRON|nr:DUF1648 domain-containing protein [Streptomyces orinoci]